MKFGLKTPRKHYVLAIFLAMFVSHQRSDPMGVTKQYTVDRIVDKQKVVLLDRDDESVQVVVDVKDFAPVNEGDIVEVTWADKVGGASYTVKLDDDETEATRKRI